MTRGSLLPSLFGHHDDDIFGSMRREVDRVFEDFGRGLHSPRSVREGVTSRAVLTPSVDISETDKVLEVSVELPGVDEKDIDVTFSDNVLTIKGEKKTESEESQKDYHLVERTYGSFQRRMRVPFEIQSENVQADFDKGVLKVTLPKPPEIEAQARKIAIKSKG